MNMYFIGDLSLYICISSGKHRNTFEKTFFLITMSIGNSKNNDIDINDLTNDINNENQVNAESANIDKQFA